MPSLDPSVDPRNFKSRKEFAEGLTELRGNRTVKQVAEKAGVPSGTISGWFADKALPRVDSEDFRKVLQVFGVIEPAEIWNWQEAVRRLGRKPPIPASPYPGLKQFEERDAAFFHGRDGLVKRLLSAVKAGHAGRNTARVVVVFGVSGSGKSSLLRAGLQAQMPKAVLITPTEQAQAELEHALADLAVAGDGDKVLIVDQCEELWAPHKSDAEDEGTLKREEFLKELSLWLTNSAHVAVIGLPEEYLGKALADPDFPGREDNVQVFVPPMRKSDLTDAIRKPATLNKIEIEDALVSVLLTELEATEAGSEPGALPLLAHALQETWAEMERQDRRRLTFEDYQSTGGIRGAVEKSANMAFLKLSYRQQEAAKRVMIAAVVVTETSQARGRVSREELTWDDIPSSDVDVVLERFTERRLLTSDKTGIQLSHEALLRAWSRLKHWIEDGRVSIMRHRRFGADAKEWESHHRDVAQLISRGRTEEYQEWATYQANLWPLSSLEQEFLAANVAHHEQQDERDKRQIATLRRSRRAFASATVVLAVVVVLLAAAIGFALKSRADRDAADKIATSRQTALLAEQLRNRDPALAQQLALAGHSIAPTFESTSTLLDSTAIPTPLRSPTVGGAISSALSTDGTLLAVCNDDSKVRVFKTDKPGHPPIATVSAPLGHLYAVAFRPGTFQLAVGGQHGAQLLDLTELANPRPPVALPGVTGKVENLAWSPAGDELAATIGAAGTARWSVTPDGTSVASATALASADTGGKAFAATAVAYSPNGELIATAGTNATIEIWDRRSTAPVIRYRLEYPTWYVLDLAFDPTSTKLAVGTTHTEALVLDLADRANPRITQHAGGFTSYINTVGFSPDGTTLAAGSSDNSVRLFDVGPDMPARQILPGPAIVTAVHLTADRIITTAYDGFVRTWPLPGPLVASASGTKVLTLTGDLNATTMIVGTRRGSQDSTPDNLPQFTITDPDNIHRRGPGLPLVGGDQSSGVATISPDGRTAAAGTKNGSLYTWDISNPQAPQPLGAPITSATPSAVAAIVFTPDSRYLLAGSGDDGRQITVVDRADPAQPRVIGHLDAGDRIQLLSVSTDGKYLAASTASTVRLWDISNRAPHQGALLGDDRSFGSTVSAVRFGTKDLLAAGSADSTIRLYRATPTGLVELAHLDGPSGQVQSLSFDPDATQLAAGIGDDQIWVWNVSNPEAPTRLAALSAYDGRVNDVVYGSRGDSFTAAGDTSMLQTWRTDPAAVVDTLCDHPASLITEAEWRQYLPGTEYQNPCD